MPTVRRDIKAGKTLAEAQQRRRASALQRQREARNRIRDSARRLALQEEEVDQTLSEFNESSSSVEPEMEMGDAPAMHKVQRFTVSRGGESHSASFYAKQLMSPEWMVDVPTGITTDWYVVPHPEGERCLVISSRGGTVSRRRNGSIVHRFPSALPNGSRATGANSDVYCILDCIFHKPDQTYYVLDIMCWKGHAVYDCNAEFRLFWVQCKLQETDAGCPPAAQHRYRFCPLPAYDCSPEGLLSAYTASVPYIKGGLLFYNKEGHYDIDGYTPLMVHWKDHNCSRYVIDTDKDGNVLPQQRVVLQYKEDGSITTGDESAIILATMPEAFRAQWASKLYDGMLLRFIVGDKGFQVVDGQPAVADIHFEGVASQRRGCADSFTKLLFQYKARNSPLSFEQIYATAQAETVRPPMAPPDVGTPPSGMGAMEPQAVPDAVITTTLAAQLPMAMGT